jgi:DAK2 domain fusion protein YloV
VDSGAYGIATFLEAFVNAYLGHEGEMTEFKTTIDEPAVTSNEAAKAGAESKVAIELNEDWAGSEYRYCTEFLFHADSADFDEEAALSFLSSMGDCELLVGTNPDYKIHVHSNEPDEVLHHMLELGQIFEVFIHNMDLEAADRTAGIAADQAAKADDPNASDTAEPAAPQVSSEPPKPLGFVAVAAGAGEADILRSLGVDYVVSGGQTMNPSTADILAAIEKVNAERVIVLPDNGNIRMAAEAAANACDGREVAVVPTKTVPQAFAAMFVVDADASLDENVAEMCDAIGEIRDGEVTTAVRDSAAADGTPIHDGDVMGIEGGKITVVGSDVQQVTLDVIHGMQEQEEGDTLTILAGSDLDDGAFKALCDAIQEAEPDLEIDSHRGEQPLYPVVFSIE